MAFKFSLASRGIFFTAFGQGFRFILTIGSTIILARLLQPEDFGLVAAIAPIIAFAELVRDLGFSQAIVQNSNASRAQLSALFCSILIATFGICLALIFGSGFVATFYNDERIAAILCVASISVFLGSVGAQGYAILNREMRFKTMVAIDIIQAGVNFSVTIVLAWLTASYWSLIVGVISMNLVAAVLSVAFSGWRISRPSFDTNFFTMARFGLNVSGANFLNYLSRNADNVLIGKFHGAVELGNYDRAYKLMVFPVWQITFPLSRVMIPILSRESDEGSYRQVYDKAVTFLAATIQPALLALACSPQSAVLILLGEDWLPIIPIFGWLSIAAIHQFVNSSHGWLFLSQGRGRDYVFASAIGSVGSVAAFFIGLPGGALGVAICYTLAEYAVRVPSMIYFAGRSGPVSSWDLISLLVPHVGATVITGGFCVIILENLFLSPAAEMFVSFASCYAIYLATMIVFPRKRRMLLNLLEGGFAIFKFW